MVKFKEGWEHGRRSSWVQGSKESMCVYNNVLCSLILYHVLQSAPTNAICAVS
jgi:hypothetical protein